MASFLNWYKVSPHEYVLMADPWQERKACLLAFNKPVGLVPLI
jgi:hypothetical protein